MKKTVLVLALMMIVAVCAVVFGEVKRGKTFSGQYLDTLRNLDRDSLQSSDVFVVNEPMAHNYYDRLFGYVAVENAVAAAAGTPGGLGNRDTVIVRLLGALGTRTDTLAVDTFLPGVAGSGTMVKYDFYDNQDAVSIVGDSTLSARNNVKALKAMRSVMHDRLWFTYTIADSTGSADTIQFTVNWMFRALQTEGLK